MDGPQTHMTCEAPLVLRGAIGIIGTVGHQPVVVVFFRPGSSIRSIGIVKIASVFHGRPLGTLAQAWEATGLHTRLFSHAEVLRGVSRPDPFGS